MRGGLPAWVDLGLLPALNLLSALLISGLVVLAVGADPIEAVRLLIHGAFGYGEAIGYTLFYATNFIFTGLAVAIAFHAGLFNIGAEGQAYLGGLGTAIAVAALGDVPAILAIPAAILLAAAFGAAWGFIPGWLQAKRGSHVVITTIMLNFVAASLMTFLLVNVFIRPGQSAPESAPYPSSLQVPQVWELLTSVGVDVGRSPLNLSFLLALGCCFLCWLLIWRSRAGYELRATGQSERAARYAGIRAPRVVIGAMTVAGACAGLMAVNEIMGAQHRLILNFTGGYGFVGIAVALMGRNHPLGIIAAAILFGALYQGGSDLAFDMPQLGRDMIVVVQGLVILFAGALEHLFRPTIERFFARRPWRPAPA